MEAEAETELESRRWNFFDSEYAAKGALYLSWNAGAARVPVPDNRRGWLNEMATARDALELLFEDGSDAPLDVQIGVEQTDRLIPDQRIETGLEVLVITRAGVALHLPGRYRQVAQVPCMQAWD